MSLLELLFANWTTAQSLFIYCTAFAKAAKHQLASCWVSVQGLQPEALAGPKAEADFSQTIPISLFALSQGVSLPEGVISEFSRILSLRWFTHRFLSQWNVSHKDTTAGFYGLFDTFIKTSGRMNVWANQAMKSRGQHDIPRSIQPYCWVPHPGYDALGGIFLILLMVLNPSAFHWPDSCWGITFHVVARICLSINQCAEMMKQNFQREITNVWGK